MRYSEKFEKKYYKSFVGSVNAALDGVVHTVRSERSMRLHFLLAFLVLIGGIYISLDSMEFMFLCFAVTMVLVSELFNTAVERAVDLIEAEYHPVAKIIKDISAGAVFVSAVNAAITGYILLVKRVNWSVNGTFLKIKQSTWHITAIALLAVVGLVLFIKVIRGERILLRGGMPSGHSAIAFAVWTIVSLLTERPLISMLVLALAVLVARSRMANKVHTFWQVVAGALIGILSSLVIFQLLY